MLVFQGVMQVDTSYEPEIHGNSPHMRSRSLEPSGGLIQFLMMSLHYTIVGLLYSLKSYKTIQRMVFPKDYSSLGNLSHPEIGVAIILLVLMVGL